MKANATRSAVLDKLLGRTDFTPPVTLYVALYTVAPTEDGGGTEVSGGSYARVAVTNNVTNFPGAVDGAKSNGTAIVFPAATALWGDIVAFGLHSHITNDALVFWGVLDDPVNVSDADVAPASFDVGTLQFEET